MLLQGLGRRRSLGGMTVYTLSLPVRVVAPALLVSSIPRNAIGFSFERGRSGLALGAFLVGAAVTLGVVLYPVSGPLGLALALWLLGTTGSLMIATSVRPMAFVKPLCSACRLLPIIEEHEALHLAGEGSDDEVWKSMRTRHSDESLGLSGDPAICWFCPIPKRLSEN